MNVSTIDTKDKVRRTAVIFSLCRRVRKQHKGQMQLLPSTDIKYNEKQSVRLIPAVTDELAHSKSK